MRETQFLSPGQEDPLEQGMAIHSVFFPGESHGQRSLAGYSPRGLKESDRTERLNAFIFHYSDINTRQRHYKKRTQQTNIPHEHNDKNPQHYIIKCSNI